MNKINTPIVVVAYNRPRSLIRLLNSLKKADYPNDDIDLIISIDKGDDNTAVLGIANNFKWGFGDKKVVHQSENLGLRAHILTCGNLSVEYGSVIVLEDDLYVSPNFYKYAIDSLRFSEGKKYIGGISLYNHQLNVHTRDNFEALDDGYDNWYFQFASSWGQAWSSNQWSGFMEWYKSKPEIDKNKNIPTYVRSWSEKSWLKYNISYLIEKDLYFLYPKVSLSTNFSDAGTHVGNDSTLYQVPLEYNRINKYCFSDIQNSNSVYDAFYENKKIAKKLELPQSELCVDLFGNKKETENIFLLTSDVLDFKIISSYGKSLKPIDANIFEEIEGDELFLYDTRILQINKINKNFKRTLFYNIKHIDFKDALSFVRLELIRKAKSGLSKVLKKMKRH